MKENKPLVSSGGKNKFFHFLFSDSSEFVPSPSVISATLNPLSFIELATSFKSFVPKTIPISPSPSFSR